MLREKTAKPVFTCFKKRKLSVNLKNNRYTKIFILLILF